MKARLALSILLPFVACATQWLLWDAFKPYVWFLFFPAAFFSAWIGGLAGGLAATVIGALLVWYVFIPPAFSFTLDNPASAFSMAVFIFMGSLFAFFFERLQQAKQHTEEALAAAEAANEKITQLYQKTLELDTLKNQFFANVSHELRTPLTLILAPLERRLHRPAGLDFPEAERRETGIMLRNARLPYRHVADLLDAAKLDAGRMTLAWSRLDLARLTRAMASHFESLATERHIDYRVTVPEKLVAEADGEKLQRILLNLLSNAFKFTPDGGVIALRLSKDDGHALIEVQDNGPGVQAAQREAVFERFSQGEGDVRRRHGGTGLGLTIVKDFVELHGGTVRLNEAPGGGALFSVRLPLAAPAGTVLGALVPLDEAIYRQAVEELEVRASTATPCEAQAAGADAPLVLVVEDNTDLNEFIVATLRPSYRVASAFDGREGMDKALALHPDLILADAMMPVMSGDEMVIALRHQPAMENVPIVMLTAKADDDLRMRMLKEGAQDYLSKPFEEEELLARVGWLIGERRRSGEKLRESEERFEATFEQAAVGIAMVAPDGRWLRVNRKLCEIVGYSHDELLTKTFQDITHPDDLDADLAYVRQMLAGGIKHYTMEKRYIRKDGSLIWINLTVALARKKDATPDYFISIIEDIQARKQAEEDLRRQKNFNLQVIDTDPNLISVKDADGKFLLVNQAMADAHGKTPQELIGQNGAEFYPNKAEADPYLEADRKVIATRHQVMLISPDSLGGKERWFLNIKTPMEQSDGTANVLSIAVDITERKLAEERLNESYQELEKLTTHLEVVREDEQKRIARELHDEMGGVLAALNMKVSLLAAHPPTEMADLMTEMDNLEKLVSAGIQALNRTVAELRPSLLDEVGLTFAIERYVQEFERNTEIECDLRLPEEELTLDGNQSSVILRIIQESLTNVAKHAKANKVSIVLSEWDTLLVLTVRDNGKGFDLNTLKTKSFGLLGIRERAAMVGGKAKITSAAGKGTTVRVSLPLIASRHEGGPAN